MIGEGDKKLDGALPEGLCQADLGKKSNDAISKGLCPEDLVEFLFYVRDRCGDPEVSMRAPREYWAGLRYALLSTAADGGEAVLCALVRKASAQAVVGALGLPPIIFEGVRQVELPYTLDAVILCLEPWVVLEDFPDVLQAKIRTFLKLPPRCLCRKERHQPWCPKHALEPLDTVVHWSDYSSQPDVRIACTQWTGYPWRVRTDLPDSVYEIPCKGKQSILYAFDARQVTCPACLELQGCRDALVDLIVWEHERKYEQNAEG